MVPDWPDRPCMSFIWCRHRCIPRPRRTRTAIKEAVDGKIVRKAIPIANSRGMVISTQKGDSASLKRILNANVQPTTVPTGQKGDDPNQGPPSQIPNKPGDPTPPDDEPPDITLNIDPNNFGNGPGGSGGGGGSGPLNPTSHGYDPEFYHIVVNILWKTMNLSFVTILASHGIDTAQALVRMELEILVQTSLIGGKKTSIVYLQMLHRDVVSQAGSMPWLQCTRQHYLEFCARSSRGDPHKREFQRLHMLHTMAQQPGAIHTTSRFVTQLGNDLSDS